MAVIKWVTKEEIENRTTPPTEVEMLQTKLAETQETIVALQDSLVNAQGAIDFLIENY